jgi:hypothetical protein
MEAKIVCDAEAFDRYTELGELGLGNNAIVTQLLEEVGENISVEQDDIVIEQMNAFEQIAGIIMETVTEDGEEEETEGESEEGEPDLSPE